MKNNIELCTASDFCAINCHAFFDGNTLPEDAGQFVQNWAKQISEAAGGKTTIVTESGWPHQGDPNNVRTFPRCRLPVWYRHCVIRSVSGAGAPCLATSVSALNK